MMYALFAIGVERTAAMLCHFCDGLDCHLEPGCVTAWDQEIEGCGAHPEDLGLSNVPTTPGFYVWVGTRPPGAEGDLDGTWSKASDGEIECFVKGKAPIDVFMYRQQVALFGDPGAQP